jgi:DNA-binding NtrC family response regulator
MLTPEVRGILRGRSLFIVADNDGTAWRALLAATIESPRPHLLLLVAAEEVHGVTGVRLGRLSAKQLVDAVRPRRLPPGLAARVGTAAERAGGLPGCFARSLWKVSLRAPSNRRLYGSRAAEQPAIYEASPPPASAPVAERRNWASASEAASIRRRAADGEALLARGRQAEGERTLRLAASALARREEWAYASELGLTLAHALAHRGRMRDAQAILADAREWAGRSADQRLLGRIATQAGTLWLESGRLDEAEAALAAALASFCAAADSHSSADAALALARCHFWRGRYADGEQLLTDHGRSAARATGIRWRIAQSRCAIGLRNPGRGVALALETVKAASEAADSGLAAEAFCASAFARLSINDYESVERDVGQAIAAAHAARRPLVAVRARLVGAEAARRAGRPSVAGGLVRRLGGGPARNIPTIVLARRDLLADLVSQTSPSADAVVRKHVQRTGLLALALFAPGEASSPGTGQDDEGMEEIVAILAACQAAEDEMRVLTDVCGRLRRRLHAAAVAFIAVERQRTYLFASDGARIEMEIAQRAVAAAAPIAPHRIEDRIEAAVPIRYGGSVVGVLAARWTLATPSGPARATPLLVMSAAAAAPIVAAASAARMVQPAAAPTDIAGVSPSTIELRTAVERAAAAPFSVLIEGESGSGKELVARAVHRRSVRRDRPFCTLNCAALPDDLVESELFGHARGAFTGAAGERHGVFEEADGGTLFLDEIGELSPRAQAKILRVLQEGELRRVGENISRRVDVRIVSATNRNLRDEVAAGRFRMDLLYRLDVLRIMVSPLRERREDIAVLADRFWRDATARIGSRATLSAAAIASLARYDWPGNVRELQNVLAALAVRSPKRGIVPPVALPPHIEAESRPERDECRLDRARQTFEKRFVRAALVRSGGRRAQAAAELGVTRQGLTKLMSRLGITD